MNKLIIMLWVTTITGNMQMWMVKEISLVKYFGFIPCFICIALIIFANCTTNEVEDGN